MLITDIERLKAFLERNGVYEHHGATHGGYRRRKPKGDRHSKTQVLGHLKPYYGRFGWGFILEAPTVGDMRQNHRAVYFIRPDGARARKAAAMAKRYKVEVIETLSRVVEIEADSEAEALRLTRELYKDYAIVLEADDFKELEIKLYND